MQAKFNSFSARAAVLAIGVAVGLLMYVASIGPVYYCWAAFNADMAVYAKLERFYSPALETASPAREYRDASQIAGYDLTAPAPTR